MQKRGQGGEAVRYLLIAAVIVFVAFFGYNLVQKVRDRACNAEIAQFGISLENLDKAVKYGSVKEFTEQAPCGADEIYFFDLSRSINFDFLSHQPLLKDSVESGAEKNVFLVKDSKIMGSFYAGSLDIGFPSYICFLPKSGRINFFLEGKGAKAAVFPGCLQPECTYIPEIASDAEAAAVLQEAKGDIETAFPESVQQHFSNFVQTRENAEVFRKYEYCRETKKTNVEITIRPQGGAELRNFRFYESIPKDCIDDLEAYLSGVEGDVSIKNDPLIVWMIDEINTERKISYELSKSLTDECKQVIAGLGVAEAINNGVTADLANVPAAVTEVLSQANLDSPITSADRRNCENRCTTGERRCSGTDSDGRSDKYQECVANPRGCLLWSSARECSGDQRCESGNCVGGNQDED